ncbi:c-type cytochrome [Flavisolibacter nicotianae]|uniref:c-type cytochrome n=1 Tax=Flavisolibacter nicotianae TaxID=2364882 RepID=UPI000EAD15DF|nr:c-type cytochrome [Flavisolibacter nicotianae]
MAKLVLVETHTDTSVIATMTNLLHQPTMLKEIKVRLLLSFAVIVFCSCSSGKENYIKNADEVKNQIDTIEFKQVAVSFREGKQLFGRFCNTCHYTPDKNVLDQYTFDNLFERLPQPAVEYFTNYISDSRALKASGDQYAKQIDDVWNNAYEHHFRDSLSASNFANLITYIKVAAKQRYQGKDH